MSNCMGGGPSGTEGEKSSGYCFSDASSSGNHHHQNMQFFEPSSEMYNNLTAGMEMMIGFPSKNHHQNMTTTSSSLHLWKGSGFFPKQHHPSDAPSSHHHQFYQQQHQNDLTAAISDHHNTLMDVPLPDHPHHQRFDLVDENDPSNLRSSSSVFTCQGNERPSQGLSLSLSSSNPSTIGLQSFELRQHHNLDDFRFGPSTSRSINIQPQLRNSKYLVPAQELLTEFCSLGMNQNDDNNNNNNISKPKSTQVENENAVKSSQSLYSLDLLDLQRRKSKLLQMLEEVDRRYRHYCDQMKAVTSSFEAVAGNGAAAVYSSLASKAMSRHFRCLRDGIVGQIKATKKAMGDKDIAAPGTAKGETPRLRVLDQTIRQQRALQQMGMLESHPWRPQRGLPERSVSVLRAWLFEHFLHPYPSDVDKHILARQTGLSRSQVSNWFINARVRLWKPMVEEMYLEELKENEGGTMGDDAVNHVDENDAGGLQQTPHQNHPTNEDQKPSHDELLRIDSECLSSLINNPHHHKNEAAKRSKPHLIGNINDQQPQQNPNFTEHHHSYGGGGGPMELDFSSYTSHHSSGGGGVSLTLGLHQHGVNGNGNGNGNGGVSLAFSQPSSSSNHHHQQHFYHHRSSEDDVGTATVHHHHHHQYSSSLLDNESGQALPYRNLMGAQLLHDSFV